MQLPKQYIKNMKELLGEEEYSAYEASLLEPRNYGLRVNTAKISVKDFLKLAPFHLTKIPYVENGFYFEEKDVPSKHPYYFAGLYYIQEPSAMLPADRLPVAQGDYVLDLCAAPGGKSTALAAKLSGSGLLVSNDISYSRAQALLKNLEMQGTSSFYVTAEEPKKLASCFPSFFDKILVDAPCSGEGMFRKDSHLIKDWTERGPAYYAEVQKTILTEAVKMLKPGGLLLYSTCTFSVEEDEKIIQELLTNFKELSPAAIRPYEGFKSGYLGLTECVRVFPHKMQGEGHFLALLKKAEAVYSKPAYAAIKNKKMLLPEHTEFDKFQQRLLFPIDEKRLLLLNGMVYLLPACFEESYQEHLRYLRTGSLIGELDKHGNFKPDQAFAMQLGVDTFKDVLNLPASDERIVKYLKGETILYEKTELALNKGYVLICVDGFSLGWGKLSQNGMIKNKYRPGWRLMG